MKPQDYAAMIEALRRSPLIKHFVALIIKISDSEDEQLLREAEELVDEISQIEPIDSKLKPNKF